MLKPTTQTIEVKDYPYGRLRTSMVFSVECDAKKGFRSVRQTIDPKTGKLNKPHKSTYSQILLLDETDGFCTFVGAEFYKIEDLHKTCAWISEHFDLFTELQKKYLAMTLYSFLLMTAKSVCVYCGASPEQVRPVLAAAMKLASKGILDASVNIFQDITVDVAALEATKVEVFNPFTIKTITFQTQEAV